MPDNLLEKALQNIYNKQVDVKNDIEPNLFHHTWSTLNGAVDKEFGKVDFGSPDFDFVHQLKNNNAVFAAYKTHREQNDIIPNLVNEKGNLRSFSDFKKANEAITSKYDHWLKTEYDTSVLRARNAANFQKFTRDADLYPNLEWLPSTSVEVRGEHVPFYHTIKPINDPFWNANYPGDLWNCKCGITNSDKEPTEATPKANYEPTPGLNENPGITGSLFSNTNAYVTNAYNGADKAVETFVNKVILKSRRAEIKKEAKKLIGVPIKNNDLKDEIFLTNRGIDEFLNQPHKNYSDKNELLLSIDKVIKNSTYKGVTTHKNKISHIFEIILNNEKSWIIATDVKGRGIAIHSISDSNKVLIGCKKPT